MKRFRLIQTNAPRSYDYEYCRYSDAFTVEEGFRNVLIPKDRVDFQVGRYHSGMHGVKMCEDCSDLLMVENELISATDSFRTFLNYASGFTPEEYRDLYVHHLQHQLDIIQQLLDDEKEIS